MKPRAARALVVAARNPGKLVELSFEQFGCGDSLALRGVILRVDGDLIGQGADPCWLRSLLPLLPHSLRRPARKRLHRARSSRVMARVRAVELASGRGGLVPGAARAAASESLWSAPFGVLLHGSLVNLVDTALQVFDGEGSCTFFLLGAQDHILRDALGVGDAVGQLTPQAQVGQLVV